GPGRVKNGCLRRFAADDRCMASSIFLRSVTLAAASILVTASPGGGAIREGQQKERAQNAQEVPVDSQKAPETVEPDEREKKETEAAEPRRWSMAGIWMMTHPKHPGAIQFREDGTFARMDGQQGRWTISTDRAGLLLVLIWPDGATDAASMIDAEHFSGRTPEGPFTVRRPGDTSGDTGVEKPKGPIEITSAMFGLGDNRVDVTLELRKLVKDGRLHIPAPWNFGSV